MALSPAHHRRQTYFGKMAEDFPSICFTRCYRTYEDVSIGRPINTHEFCNDLRFHECDCSSRQVNMRFVIIGETLVDQILSEEN